MENLLLLPGLLCDTRLWADVTPGLVDLARPVVADLTLDDEVGAMADRAVADMPPGPFALCGLSMGGYVALAVMRRHSARVTRLCIMDSSARPDTEQQARRRRGLMALTRAGAFRGVTPRLLPQLVHPARVQEQPLAGEVMAMAERVGKEAFLRQQTAILSRPDSRPELATIAVPTMIAVGAQDALTPPHLAEEMAGLIPGAALRVIDDSGHLPPMERPEATLDVLRDWLGR